MAYDFWYKWVIFGFFYFPDFSLARFANLQINQDFPGFDPIRVKVKLDWYRSALSGLMSFSDAK